ncbi:hypothetical protein [Bradyrhizobium erythrophlei]|uniref:hypothetical protein n=1 Tax=Bradyrhizobium erythrophlei TaxID=1437360 RepID=UPI0009A7F83A|nr:hypothetical protein [Bradyrhizobium erythrophlei]
MAGKTRVTPGQVQTEVIVEQFRKNRHVKRVHSTCSDFDREWNSIEASANLGHHGRVFVRYLETGLARGRSLNEEFDGREAESDADVQSCIDRRNRKGIKAANPLAICAERLATGG